MGRWAFLLGAILGLVLASTPLRGQIGPIGPGGGGSGGGTPGGSNTQVQFNDGGSFGGDAGLTYLKASDKLTIGAQLQVGALQDATAQVQFTTLTQSTGNYLVAFASGATVENTADNASAVLTAYYLDAIVTLSHNASFASGHDFTNLVDVAAGKTTAFYINHILDSRFTGGGTITDFYGTSATPYFDATQVTRGRSIYLDPPQLSNGAAIGTWNMIEAADLAGTTVATAKRFIDYASGKFRVDSAGAITGASTLTLGTAGGTTGASLFKGTTSGTVTLSVADIAGSWTMKLPTTAGTSGYSLTTDGTGVTTWTNVSGGSGAPADATYITQTANGTLTNEQALSTLASGIMRVATATGVVTSLTDSAGIAANISDETGTGVLVFGTSPTFTTGLTTPLVNLSASSNQLVFQSGGTTGTLTWTPATANRTITIPNTTGTLPVVQGNSGTASSTTTSATETNLGFVLIPGGSLGTNGRVFVNALYKFTGANNIRVVRIRLSTSSGDTTTGAVIFANGNIASTQLSYYVGPSFWNTNSASAQIMSGDTATSWGLTGSAPTTGAINTANDAYVNFNASCANNSTDTAQLVGYTVWVVPGV